MNRKDAVELIHKQLDYDYCFRNKNAPHYGRLELRELLDEIYGGPPLTESERIMKDEEDI